MGVAMRDRYKKALVGSAAVALLGATGRLAARLGAPDDGQPLDQPVGLGTRDRGLVAAAAARGHRRPRGRCGVGVHPDPLAREARLVARGTDLRVAQRLTAAVANAPPKAKRTPLLRASSATRW